MYYQQPGFESLIPQSLLNSKTILSIAYSSSNNIAPFTGQSASTAHYTFANEQQTTFRLYSKNMYDKEMLEEYEPEIVNTNLSTIILQLHKMGINLAVFLTLKFISAPTIESVVKSIEEFFYLDAMNEQGILTDIGKSMSKFQMDVTLARCLIESYSLNCIKEILIIISVLQLNELFFDIEKIDKDYIDPRLGALSLFEKNYNALFSL